MQSWSAPARGRAKESFSQDQLARISVLTPLDSFPSLGISLIIIVPVILDRKRERGQRNGGSTEQQQQRQQQRRIPRTSSSIQLSFSLVHAGVVPSSLL